MRMKHLIAIVALVLIGCAYHAPRAKPSDNVFPLLAWEVPATKEHLMADATNGIASMRDAGFTVAAFPTPQQLPTAEKAGLKAIVAFPDHKTKWREMSDEQIRQRVKELVDQAGKSDAVIGYFLMDEPGVQFFPALGKAVAAVKEFAPGKLAYINLFPDYATLGAENLSQLGTPTYREYLERYVAEVKPQFISYDNYQVQFSDDLKQAKGIQSYFGNLLEVREVALKHGLPFWQIVSSNQIRPRTLMPSPANMLLQAYTTLAAGARGLTWYTYYNRGYHYAPIDDVSGSRSVTWSYLKMVNEQVKTIGPVMNTLKSTGVYFTSPPIAPGRPTLPGKIVQAIDAPAPVMVGEFADAGGAKYAMVVNLSLERSNKVGVKAGESGATWQVCSPVDAKWSAIGKDNEIWLAAGQGALLRLQTPAKTTQKSQ